MWKTAVRTDTAADSAKNVFQRMQRDCGIGEKPTVQLMTVQRFVRLSLLGFRGWANCLQASQSDAFYLGKYLAVENEMLCQMIISSCWFRNRCLHCTVSSFLKLCPLGVDQPTDWLYERRGSGERVRPSDRTNLAVSQTYNPPTDDMIYVLYVNDFRMFVKINLL